MYRSLFPTRAGSAPLRVLAVLTVAAAALTTALAGSAQAVSKPPPGTFGIRLVDIPVKEANNPRAYRYIIDHLNPGTTV